MGGRRKHPCSYRPSARGSSSKARLLGKFKVELGVLAMGLENRNGVVTAPVDSADLRFKQSGGSQMASAWRRPEADGAGDLRAIGLHDRKKPE